jgi:uncharacterized protein (TIGR02391 family)
LLESGISPENIDDAEMADSPSLLFAVFIALAEGTSGQRRELREFLGAWLDDWLHTGPAAEVREALEDDFSRQGWFVKERSLVIGEPKRGTSVRPEDIGRDVRLRALHERIQAVAIRPFEAGELAASVFEAFKAINSRVKTMTGLELDGRDLMAHAFRSGNPALLIPSAADSKTAESVQAGYRFLLMGAMAAIRNPHAHAPAEELAENDALERLGFASYLMRILDGAQAGNS